MPLAPRSDVPRTAGVPPAAAPRVFGASRIAIPLAVALAVAGRLLLPIDSDGGGDDTVLSAEAVVPGLPQRATRPPLPRPSTRAPALQPAPGTLWPLAPAPVLFLPTPLPDATTVAAEAGPDRGGEPAL